MFTSKLPQFEGLMAPTFTPFDQHNEVNYLLIDPYAKLLKSKGISAILVNGTSGEGTSLSVQERKKVTEVWAESCHKHDIAMMVQISGCPFVDAVNLAQHAAALKVDGVLCLPELYFKPKTPEKLVSYLKEIALHCPNIPLYYYHIPMFTQVDLPLDSFMELARKEIPSFVGLKYTSGDLEKGVQCLKHGQVWLGSDTILAGALTLGFTNAIMTSLNINPEISIEILKLIEAGKVTEARDQQNRLNVFVAQTLKNGKITAEALHKVFDFKFAGNGEWVPSMKKAFNDKFKEINLGETRKPF